MSMIEQRRGFVQRPYPGLEAINFEHDFSFACPDVPDDVPRRLIVTSVTVASQATDEGERSPFNVEAAFFDQAEGRVIQDTQVIPPGVDFLRYVAARWVIYADDTDPPSTWSFEATNNGKGYDVPRFAQAAGGNTAWWNLRVTAQGSPNKLRTAVVAVKFYFELDWTARHVKATEAILAALEGR